MAQIFDRSSNALARMSLILTGLIVIALGVTLDQLQRSPWVTRQGQRADQPVPFSHKHHVQGLGIQCQYCHTSVEKSSYAGIPPTKTCMNCHSQIWTNANLLLPVRTSWAMGNSITWTKVHDLPDYAYFNHSIHVNKGMGCSTCHGRVDQMPLMYQQSTLQMEWCLNCHRNAPKNIRPVLRGLQHGVAVPHVGEASLVRHQRIEGGRTHCADRELRDERPGSGRRADRVASNAGHHAKGRKQFRRNRDAGFSELHQVHQPGRTGNVPREAIQHPLRA